MKRERSPSSDNDIKPSLTDTEFKPSVSPSPSTTSNKKRRAKSSSKDTGKAGHAPGRSWTGAECAALFKLVNEVGKAEAFATFPGRTKNQAYQAWRCTIMPTCIKALEARK